MHAITVQRPDDSTFRVVLRRYADAERLARDPWYVPAHEALALELIARNALPVPAPRLVAADLDASHGDVPAILETWLPGSEAWQAGNLDAYLLGAVTWLWAIHTVRVSVLSELPRYAPYERLERIEPPRFSRKQWMWMRVLEILRAPWPSYSPTLIHRDYHPGNVLWDGARVTGVVDWATAAIGPPGIDLARMRLNLASRHGHEIADRFTVAYVGIGGSPTARHPFWDLLDAVDCLPDTDASCGPGGGDFALFEDYVERVLAELTSS